MRVTLLGAGGGLGALVREALVGHDVTAVPREHARDASKIAALGGEAIVNCAGASVAMSFFRGWRGYGAVDVPIGFAAVAAARATNARLVYTAVAHAPEQRSCAYIAAHERVAEAMADINGCVVRPTGFFSAYASLLPMAKARGKLFDIGDGTKRTNPIHERDVAAAIAAQISTSTRELSIGGPEILTRRQIFETVASHAGRPVKINGAPLRLAAFGGWMLRWMIHPRIGQFVTFAVALAKHDVIAPAVGTARLADYFA